jgi:hypothetical protein
VLKGSGIGFFGFFGSISGGKFKPGGNMGVISTFAPNADGRYAGI